MHGRVKIRTSAEEQEAKRKEKEKKAKIYRASLDKLFAKRLAGEYDDEIIAISWQLLIANPDITTIWNIRREALLHLQNNNQLPDDEVQEQLKNELKFTEQCLRKNPKSYGAWHHRCWVLKHMPEPTWEQELMLCNKYLELDERNFHTWDYRKIVVEHLKVPAAAEFDYSTKKIMVNFSNYSSWHYRSRLLPYIYPHPSGSLPIREDKHKEELELVHNAAFTDPNDQSAWFYQRWLLGRSRQPLTIALGYISKQVACVVLTQSISISGDFQLVLQIGEDKVPATWVSSNGDQYSHVWFSVSVKETIFENENSCTMLTLFDGAQEVHKVPLERLASGDLKFGVKPQFSASFSEGITSVLESELDSCNQLLDLEPDSKWTLLTTVLLMQAINRVRFEDDTFEKLKQLIHEDPHRTGYYRDLRSRYKMEYAIDGSKVFSEEISLSHLNLTSLYHCQYLSCVHAVDLSHNCLTNRSLPQLHALQCCKVLNLDANEITSLQGMPALVSLQSLSLRYNCITAAEEVESVKKACSKLVTLDLSGNPVQVL